MEKKFYDYDEAQKFQRAIGGNRFSEAIRFFKRTPDLVKYMSLVNLTRYYIYLKDFDEAAADEFREYIVNDTDRFFEERVSEVNSGIELLKSKHKVAGV